MEALLLSNSTMYGEPYLDWCSQHIVDFIGDCSTSAVFIPYAGVTIEYEDYFQRVKEALPELENFKSLHQSNQLKQGVENASVILVGGGNTFQLLKTLQDLDLMEPLKRAVSMGAKYIGWSAGSNVAGNGIHTTNDMPIVQPKSFDALQLVPFNINPHYTNKTIEGHGGESRIDRLKEFRKVSEVEVVAMEEGTGIKVSNQTYTKVGNSKLYKLGVNGALTLFKTGLWP